MTIHMWNRHRILALLLVLSVPCAAVPQTSQPSQDASWQRVTAHLNGVFSPRGFFNILVRLYSLPSLKSAQFNLRQSSVILDFPPGTSPITSDQIQRIEKDAGYRPGSVEIQKIPVHSFAENGPGWTKIKHPQSKYTVIRWLKQNF